MRKKFLLQLLTACVLCISCVERRPAVSLPTARVRVVPDREGKFPWFAAGTTVEYAGSSRIPLVYVPGQGTVLMVGWNRKRVRHRKPDAIPGSINAFPLPGGCSERLILRKD